MVLIFFFVLFYFLFEWFYFKSGKFLSLKESISRYTDECNDLNAHIESLKSTALNFQKTNFGHAEYIDNSSFNFKRPELKKHQVNSNIYECSLTVCRNAQQQPFKYLCKYFNIKPTEEALQEYESILNRFCAAENGKVLLIKRRDELINSISKQIPFVIRFFRKKTVARKLGFKDVDMSQLYFPKYSFVYISAGGNSSMRCDIVLDIQNLEKFISYLAGLIKFKKSVAGQRALMTPALREKIKARDNYTCRNCAVSIVDEPHLLLEIDHIVPLAKGGFSIEDNLQTLCWKCNRSKGAKNPFQ